MQIEVGITIVNTLNSKKASNFNWYGDVNKSFLEKEPNINIHLGTNHLFNKACN